MAESTKRDKDRDGSSHPIGTAGGAFAGGAAGGVAGAAIAGATVGTAAGPAGTVIGAAVGAVAGAVAGHKLAERINPSAEDEYWRSNYSSRPYVNQGAGYDDYAPAYRLGWERYPDYHGRNFDEVEHEFERDWDTARGDSRLAWNDAKHATRDSFQRIRDNVERMTPGDSDRDGK
jgi:hypothetical protein